ncbi:MAG TPA: AAA family ATPase [Vicinamibacterales bacterium]|jgi:hypothetical protein
MSAHAQQDVISFLSTPSTYGGGVANVERVETHAAIVFLAGARAYKLKRAIRFDYLDYSTVDRRRASCEAEVALNRRTAPALYLGTLPVTRGRSGALQLGGDEAPVDWVVEMVRFDQETLFDRLAARGALPISLMPPLAASISALHAAAAPVDDHGGRAGLAWAIDGNEAGLLDQGRDLLDAAAVRRLIEDTRVELDRQGERLDVRRRDGLVRRCHGDLHLRNICLLDGRPTIFDAVEFNDAIACVDVFYDLAFLLMDLWRRGLHAHANAVFNEYLTQSGDLAALPVLPLFLSCRAAVRAKTSATAAGLQSDAAGIGPLRDASREYLAMAARLLHPAAPRLVAIGGLSGAGKSTIARAVAAGVGRAPGAVIVRSDVVRKQLRGVDPLTRLPEEGYAPPVTEQVYAVLRDRAALILRSGQAVVVDAVYGRPDERDAIERVAAEAGVPFSGVWLDAPVPVMAERLSGRRGDASDATTDVLAAQAARERGPLGWTVVDASGDPEAVQRRVEAALVA